MDELKLCPFCGGEPFIKQYKDFYLYKVICENCHVETGGWREKRKAVKAWNRREDDKLLKYLDDEVERHKDQENREPMSWGRALKMEP
jgi:Lar family restriction alleviation protein